MKNFASCPSRSASERNLANMVCFAEVFPDLEILHALRAKLGWTHFQTIIWLDDPLERDFYAEMCRIENWSTRTLEKKIGGMLFLSWLNRYERKEGEELQWRAVPLRTKKENTAQHYSTQDYR